MNWAKERVERAFNRIRDEKLHRGVTYDDYIDGFAAELQRVADECADAVENAPLKGKLLDGDEFWRGPMNFAADIRARFPKEGQ